MDDELLKIFAHNVKIERIKKSLSQQQLAELTGFSVPYISNIENAKHKISLVSACEISRVLGKSLDEMLQKQN